MSIVEPAFAVENAGKRVGEHTLLEDVSFTIAPGQRVALIGASGAGKTSLLRLLDGVLWPTTGRVKSLGVDTQELRGKDLRELRRRIGFLYQSDNLVPGLRVVHNVRMGQLGRMSLWHSICSLIAPSKLDAVRAALREVELEDKLWSLPDTLSGGEQQRVALARLQMQAPCAILADEPVSSLDVRLGRQTLDRLTSQAAENGTTLIISLHDLTLVDERFDRVLALKNGGLAFDCAPSELDTTALADLYGAEFELFRDEGQREDRR